MSKGLHTGKSPHMIQVSAAVRKWSFEVHVSDGGTLAADEASQLEG